MLCIRTRLQRSKIHGLGVITLDSLAKGEELWRFHKDLDQRIRLSEVHRLPRHSMDALLHYCYINPDAPDLIVLCADDARFMNFDDPANTEVSTIKVDGEFSLVAARDIKAGEELTVPFNSDADAARKMGFSASSIESKIYP